MIQNKTRRILKKCDKTVTLMYMDDSILVYYVLIITYDLLKGAGVAQLI
jgi:hypothetical protein